MILETERLILRPWKDSDAESLYLYAKDPAVGPVTGWLPHRSVEDSLFVIRNFLTGPECYAVCLKGSDSPIGSIELLLKGATHVTAQENECELGYWLGKPHWGNGYIPEAARELMRRGFTELGMQTVWCAYFEGNEKSKRVQEKLGFVYERTDENVEIKPLGETRTLIISRLTKESWQSGMTVRPLADEEIFEALELTWRVFNQYETPDYAPEGTAEFKKTLADESYLNGLVWYGAFDGPRLIGVLAIRKKQNHLCFFFVEGEYHRLGIGTRLFQRMKEDFARMSITINSAPYGTPFYLALGCREIAGEQTKNGIRFTPMIHIDEQADYRIVKLSDAPAMWEEAARWYASKWSIPEQAYYESIEDSRDKTVPAWYLCLNGEHIIGGAGVIENDFHDCPDLTPNVCAVYTEPYFRNQGIAGKMLSFICEDFHTQGIDTLYLITGHTGFYERYGWTYHCDALGDGEEKPSRIYVHHYGR